VLDSGTYVRWLQRFRAATSTSPRLWGLHNYSDVTDGRTTGTDAVLAAVPGRLWIEETGGIVPLRNAAGLVTLATDEARAAAAVSRAFAIARTRPRVTRLYLYQWRAGAQDRFDAGLVRPDGTARPGLGVLARALRAATPSVRWSATWSSRGRLVVRATCRATGGRCRGRATVALRLRAPGTTRWTTRTIRTRAYATSATRRTVALTLRVSARLRRLARPAARRRLRVAVRPLVPAGTRSAVTLALRRPR
jgi:hypothetical protein